MSCQMASFTGKESKIIPDNSVYFPVAGKM